MLVVVFQVVDFLECFVVRVGGLLDVSHQGLVLEVEPPVLFEVVDFVFKIGFLERWHVTWEFNR